MRFLRIVYRDPIALDPRVGFELAVDFARTDAYMRYKALPSERPPERQRFFQAGRRAPSVADGGVDHARGDLEALCIGQGLFQASRQRRPRKRATL